MIPEPSHGGDPDTLLSSESKCHLRAVIFGVFLVHPSAWKKRNSIAHKGVPRGSSENQNTCLAVYCCAWGRWTILIFLAFGFHSFCVLFEEFLGNLVPVRYSARIQYSGARGPPQFLKKRSENAGANENLRVGSRQFRESLRELLRELWVSYWSSRERPFREWNFVFREWNFQFRELLREYPGTLRELREWPSHSESVFPEIGVVPRLLIKGFPCLFPREKKEKRKRRSGKCHLPAGAKRSSKEIPQHTYSPTTTPPVCWATHRAGESNISPTSGPTSGPTGRSTRAPTKAPTKAPKIAPARVDFPCF